MQRLFTEQVVEVPETNGFVPLTLVAPLVTSTISVTTSNLDRWEVVATTEAFGRSFRLAASVFPGWGSRLSFPVFDGVWTLSVQRPSPFYFVTPVIPPAPVTVAVTNGLVAVTLVGTPGFTPTQQVQRVRAVTTDGTGMSNVAISAFSYDGGASAYGLEPVDGDPTVRTLSLVPGRWQISATPRGPTFEGPLAYRVEREVTITSNAAPPELILVFPTPDAGPRLFGIIRRTDGTPLPGLFVNLSMRDAGTNNSVQLMTDAAGMFGTNVLPGLWRINLYAANCPVSALVNVSISDVRQDLEVCVAGAANGVVPVTVSHQDEDSPYFPFQIQLFNGLNFITTDAAFPPVLTMLAPGVWTATLSPFGYLLGSDPYSIDPIYRWQLAPGVATTNLVLVTRSATSRIEGRIRDEQGRLISTGYAAAWTSVNGTNYQVGVGVNSGYFSLPVFPGEWQVGASVSSYPIIGVPGDWLVAVRPITLAGSEPTPYYTTPPSQFLQVTGSVTRCSFLVTNLPPPESVSLKVKVVEQNGQALTNAYVSASSGRGSAAWSGPNGEAQLTVERGPISVSAYIQYADPSAGPLAMPTLDYEAGAPSNYVVLVVRHASLCLTGSVANPTDEMVKFYVGATTRLQGTNYSVGACTDVSGHFCLPAFPGPWTVALDQTALNGLGLKSVSPQTVDLSLNGNQLLVQFRLEPINGDFREARLLPPLLQPNGTRRLALSARTTTGWLLEQSQDLRVWQPISLQWATNGEFSVDVPASAGAAFYRARWVK